MSGGGKRPLAGSRPDAGRRRVRVFAFGIAALFAIVALVSFLGSRENLRAGSSEDDGPPVRITSVPNTYTATYRVENRAGGELVVTTEKYWVRRPFDSRIEAWRGPPPGTTRLTVRYSTFATFATEGGAAQPLNLAVPPALASGDLRVDAALPEAVRDRTVLRRERRTVYGRACQVYRTGGPVSAGDLTPYKAGIGEFADVCVDRHGLVLEEAWTSDGKLVRRRVAVRLAVNPSLDDDQFRVRIAPSAASLQGRVQRVDLAPEIWSLRTLPEGFRSLGLYDVAVPSVALPQSPSGVAAVAPESTTEVFVNGPDLLVVDQDPSLARYIEADDRPAKRVDLRPLRNGELVADARMSEVRGATPDGSAVRILGTLPPSELVRLARSIVKR